MNIKHLMPLLLSGFMLSACDKQMSESNCSSETAYKLIGQTITEAVEKKQRVINIATRVNLFLIKRKSERH
jgi:hypothetical protein